MPLDSIAAVPPQVSFANNQLTIVAPNSTLADILKAVRKQTGADIEVPTAPDRVVTHLGPGPARDVIADLLNGSRFNYVLLGSPGDDSVLTRVVLVPKSAPEGNVASPGAAAPNVEQAAAQPGADAAAQPEQDASQDAEAEQPADESATDDSDQQPAEDAQEQQQAQQQQDQQQNVKTPQQMLQEMQQRQTQLQQQQQSGQPVNPGLAPRGPQQQQ